MHVSVRTLCLFAFASLTTSLTACPGPQDTSCSRANHCSKTDGQDFCDPGFTFEHPDVAGNFVCVKQDQLVCRDTNGNVTCPDGFVLDESGSNCVEGTSAQCRGLDLQQDGVLDLDVKRVRVTGKITLGGHPINGTLNGAIGFVTADDSTPFFLPVTSRYSVDLSPANYRIELSVNDCEGDLPCGGGTVIKSVALTADGTLDIDIPVVNITGAVKLDGATLPTQDTTFLQFTSGAHTGTKAIGDNGSYAVHLMPATYAVTFNASQVSCDGTEVTSLPCNTGVVVPEAKLTASGVLDVNVHTLALTGKVTLNTRAINNGTGALGFDGLGMTPLFIAIPDNGRYALRLLRGEYTAHYVDNSACSQDGTTSSGLPCTGQQVTACQ